MGKRVDREFRKTGLRERQGHLSRAVGTEVEEDDRVTVFDGARRSDEGRLYELVVLVACVRGLERGKRRLRVKGGFAGSERVVSALGAVPALVAIHRVVAADDRRDGVGP